MPRRSQDHVRAWKPDISTGELAELGEPLPQRPRPVGARDQLLLTFVQGPTAGRVVPLRQLGSTVIGRGPEASVRVPDPSVSRTHVRLRVRDGEATIEDLDSFGGTWIDGRPVRGELRLPCPCRVNLGGRVGFRVDRFDQTEAQVLLRLHDAAVRDPLTGAYNRRYLDDRLAAEISFARRHRSPFALAMLDLDHFKRVNDEHGHDAGDVVLQTVVELVSQIIRPEDVLVRYGGEELCLLLRGLRAGEGEALAERVRRATAQLAIPSRGRVIRVTLSAGVADLTDCPEPTGAQLLHAADEALYRAKARGRNRVARA